MSGEETVKVWQDFVGDLREKDAMSAGGGGPANAAYLRAVIHRADHTRSVLILAPVQENGQMVIKARRFEEGENEIGKGSTEWLQELGIMPKSHNLA